MRARRQLRVGGVTDRVGRLDAELDEHLDQRPVRDALAVRERAAARDGGGSPTRVQEVGHQPRLADAGRTDSVNSRQVRVATASAKSAAQPLPLAFAADERRVEVPRDAGRRASSVSSRCAGTGSGFPFSAGRPARS